MENETDQTAQPVDITESERPHIRQRLYFVADPEHFGHGRQDGLAAFEDSDKPQDGLSDGDAGDSGNTNIGRRKQRDTGERTVQIADEGGTVSGGDDTLRPRLEGHGGDEREWRGPGWLRPEQARSFAAAGATRGFWGGCDWWAGTDDKWRPIKPGVFPLAHGYPARVGLLRLGGDAIVVPQAAEFIRAYCEARDEMIVATNAA